MRNLLNGLIIYLLFFTSNCLASGIHIRLNQVGYLLTDQKIGVVLSDQNLDKNKFEIISVQTGKAVHSGQLRRTQKRLNNFDFIYDFSFTEFKSRGEFSVRIKDSDSFPFEVGASTYVGLVDTLLQFFKVQRCGFTSPFFHDICHKADATSLLFGKRVNRQTEDVTGGWHDAADYIKFFNTIAYTTYTLLFSYDYDNQKFESDKDKDGAPDILQECRVGLDWLHRAHFRDDLFITQVQDMRDHEVGWRLPENDPLEFDRPAFTGTGKNLIGIYSATMALASRIWRTRFQDIEFADRCLASAKQTYDLRNDVPDLDKSGTGMYQDSKFEGKLALGAIELYISTGGQEYFDDAVSYARSAGSDYWWSWGDINSYAHYRIAKYDPIFRDFIRQNLDHFRNSSRKKLFMEGADYSWGTNHTLMGVALQAILYKQLTRSSEYDSLLYAQRDFVLGKNQWGVSFIHNVGSNFTKNFHHQISYLKNGYLPGGFAAGPVPKNALDSYKIQYEKRDKYISFQTEEGVYRDDRMDYVSNEPTIVANAAAIFVMAYFIK